MTRIMSVFKDRANNSFPPTEYNTIMVDLNKNHKGNTSETISEHNQIHVIMSIR